MSHLRAPAVRADRREGGRHGRPAARTVPATAETHIRPQLLRLAVLPPTAVALSACAAVLFTVRSTGARPSATLWAVLAGAVAVTGVGIVVAAVAADRAARSVSDRVAALRRHSARGEADLRALIDALRRGETPPPRKTRGGPPGDADEFELLAADLARAHDGAVGAVVQASQLSSHAGSEQKLEVFVNLARRLQSLVHREISILDELENEIEDPALLKGLFHVDHLATRIRRHAENLAVLGGAVSRRQWSNPVSMTEVLRSAIAEVEQYSRVRLVPPIDGELRGHAVADVIHLLAELVENATVFSAPHTQVLLRANLVTSGLAVEVEDRGLGMPVDEQSRMNALLADPDQVNVGRLLADGRIGLFVVSQLARRHGIRVRLQNNIYGGVQAVLVVPQDLLGPAPGLAVPQGRENTGGGAPHPPSTETPAHGVPGVDRVPSGTGAGDTTGGARHAVAPRREERVNGAGTGARPVVAAGAPRPPERRTAPAGHQPPHQPQLAAAQPDPAGTAARLPRRGRPLTPAPGTAGTAATASGRGPAPRTGGPDDPAATGGGPHRDARPASGGPGGNGPVEPSALSSPSARHDPASSNERGAAPLPVRGAHPERANPAEAVPGIRPADRPVVEGNAGIVPVPRSGAVRGTMGKPQLPRRRAQEHIAPQLRGGPAPRQDAEQPAGHDPGLMAAFQRGIGLAEAQQSLEAEGTESASFPAWEALEHSSYPVSDALEAVLRTASNPAPTPPSPAGHPAPDAPSTPAARRPMADDLSAPARRSTADDLSTPARRPVSDGPAHPARTALPDGPSTPARTSAPDGRPAPSFLTPPYSRDVPTTPPYSRDASTTPTSPISEATPPHAPVSSRAHGVRDGLAAPGDGAGTDHPTPRHDGSASAG
ncbi:ATP-binding protein [Streptomyces phaeofaciens]